MDPFVKGGINFSNRIVWSFSVSVKSKSYKLYIIQNVLASLEIILSRLKTLPNSKEVELAITKSLELKELIQDISKE